MKIMIVLKVVSKEQGKSTWEQVIVVINQFLKLGLIRAGWTKCESNRFIKCN